MTRSRDFGAAHLRELALLFLRLGVTAFGGPAAHIALMEDEAVRRRRWLTQDRFLDYLAATNLIPGPSSTELALFIGHARGGLPGLLVAGVSFIVPAALIVAATAFLYVHYGTLPQVEAILYGIKPVVIAVVAQALWGLAGAAVKSAALGLVGVAAGIAILAGVHELLVLTAAGMVSVVLQRPSRTACVSLAIASAPPMYGAAATAVVTKAGVAVTLWPLFLVFLKTGAVLFGSGYVLLAFLRADLVERLGWLTEEQLLDAIAIGQITPGPLFTTATFIGYLLAGVPGAVVATIGIFLPGFVLVALGGAVVPRLRRSATAGAVLDGITVASLAMMAVVSWQLSRAALVDAPTMLIAAISLIALIRYRVSATWLIAAGAAVGWWFAG